MYLLVNAVFNHLISMQSVAKKRKRRSVLPPSVIQRKRMHLICLIDVRSLIGLSFTCTIHKREAGLGGLAVNLQPPTSLPRDEEEVQAAHPTGKSSSLPAQSPANTQPNRAQRWEHSTNESENDEE